MDMRYKHRWCEKTFFLYLDQFPVVILTGPRQSGKSTLLKNLFSSQWNCYSLDQRGTLARIIDDPDLFVQDLRGDTIIDEAQKAPDLFHAIKYHIDNIGTIKFILSGSANFRLLKSVTETLAGRAGLIELFPFSLSETKEIPSNFFFHAIFEARNTEDLMQWKPIHIPREEDIFDQIINGGYPKIWEYEEAEQKYIWFENYRSTYIERDLRDLAQLDNLHDFQKLYQLLAFQTANLLNLANIANDIGFSPQTAKKYLRILQSSYQYYLLYPYLENMRKRLIKTPKVYLMDTGIGNFFLENHNQEVLKKSGRFGNIFETWVIGEIVKQISLMIPKPNLYFWRTSNGAEVDLIMERGARLIPIEIKSNVKINPKSLLGIRNFIQMPRDQEIPFGVVIYRGNEIYRIKEKIIAVPLTYCLL